MNRRSLILAVGGIVSLAMVLLISPLLLLLVQRLYGVDWSVLSSIGQSYTGTAALLSVLALGAVAYSILLQTKQNRVIHLQASRQMQFTLTQMMIEHENLADIFGESDDPELDEPIATARWFFRTLWFRYMHYSYAVGEFDADSLRRALLHEFFSLPSVSRALATNCTSVATGSWRRKGICEDCGRRPRRGQEHLSSRSQVARLWLSIME
jgi:Family of unknown function (DUF6082)